MFALHRIVFINFILNVKSILVLFFLLTFCINTAMADGTYGKSCTNLDYAIDGRNTILDYVKNYVPYYEIQDQFDVELDTDLSGCSPTAAGSITLNVCNTNSEYCSDASNPSGKVTFTAGNTYKLGEIIGLTNNKSKLVNSVLSSNGLKDLSLSVQYNSLTKSTCLSMPTMFAYVPLMCVQYNGSLAMDSSATCNAGMSSSCMAASAYSLSQAPMFSRATQCIQDSLYMTFWGKNTCAGSSVTPLIATFAAFQSAIRQFVLVMFAFFVLTFGYRMFVGSGIDMHEMMSTGMKFMAIFYFAIGFGNSNGGMTDYILPLAVNGSNNFATFLYQQVGQNNICKYNTSQYDANYKSYALWDSLDCRLQLYLGIMKVLWTDEQLTTAKLSLVPGDSEPPNNQSSVIYNPSSSDKRPKSLKNSDTLGVVYMLVGFGMALEIKCILGLIAFVATALFSVLSLFGAYAGNLITMYLLAYVSPIFIPMALFQKTRSIFGSWMNAFLGTIIQPIILIGFMGILFFFIDSVFFGIGSTNDDQSINAGCNMTRYISTSSNSSAKKSMYFRIVDTCGYSDAGTFNCNCSSSTAVKFFQYLQQGDKGWSTVDLLLFEGYKLKDTLGMENGMLATGAVCALIFCIAMQLTQIVQGLVGGLSLSAFLINIGSMAKGVFNNTGGATLKMQAGAMAGQAKEKMGEAAAPIKSFIRDKLGMN